MRRDGAYLRSGTLPDHLRSHRDATRRGGRAAGARALEVEEAKDLIAERFADHRLDGPIAYASFLPEPGDEEEAARQRQQAVAAVAAFLSGLRHP